jgi:hypothetical protein
MVAGDECGSLDPTRVSQVVKAFDDLRRVFPLHPIEGGGSEFLAQLTPSTLGFSAPTMTLIPAADSVQNRLVLQPVFAGGRGSS